MATLHVLETYYSNILRVDFGLIPQAAKTDLGALADQVDDGDIDLAQALAGIVAMADQTTSVANLSYQFFTGRTPRQGGLDYLVSPSGDNPNNLNSPYYASFNLENRYINFAVNLGKAGEGAAAFEARYGALSLHDAVGAIYAEIFGVSASAEKIDGLIDAPVGDGAGGQQSRAAYFASYGLDGLEGVGTKAAFAGWLLAEAQKADLGAYAQANAAFLTDLGPDGLAAFYTDLTDTYGAPDPASPGATIAVAANQSVSPDQADTALRATAHDDVVTGAAGLAAGQSIVTVQGADVITVAGDMGGLIDAGDGDDTVSLGRVLGPVEILGGAVTGTVRLGAGNDQITVTDGMAFGATLDGGAGEDTGYITGQVATISGVERLFVSGGGDFSGVAGAREIWGVSGGLAVNNAPEATYGLRDASASLTVAFAQTAGDVDLHLDNVSAGMENHLPTTNIGFSNMTGVLHVHVDSDSSVNNLSTDAGQVTIDGVGRFTGNIQWSGPQVASQIIDASAASGVELGFQPRAQSATVVLSSGDDVITGDLQAASRADFTLGAGDDLFAVRDIGPTQTSFTNLSIADDHVVTWAAITDFEAGSDHLDLGVAITALVPDLQAQVGAATSLEQALINVAAHMTANSVGVFEYGGDTWIYRQDATGGVNTGDGLIQLVGVGDLTTSAHGGDGDILFG